MGTVSAGRRFFVRYLGVVALASLVWEFVQMPLYGVWETGSAREIIYSGLHCTVGDVMIATAALLVAIILVGGRRWPRERRLRVAVAAISVGLTYTAFSEWLNVYVRHSWTYAELMPIIPGTGIGLSPILQWIVVPAAAFVVTERTNDLNDHLRRFQS